MGSKSCVADGHGDSIMTWQIQMHFQTKKLEDLNKLDLKTRLKDDFRQTLILELLTPPSNEKLKES